MSNVVLYPGSGILEFNTGVAGQSVLDNSLTGASRFSFNSGEINLTNYATGNLNRFTIDGSQGRLFLIDDQLSGSLFSVNTIAGLPVVEAFSDNTITLGQYGRYDLVVTGNAVGIGVLPDTGSQKLCVSLSGITPYVVPSNPLSIVGSGNTYIQVHIQNRATGNNASTDLIISANDGTDSTYYLDLGLNNVGYSQAAYGNVSGHDGYLYINGGNLTVGTQTVGTAVEIHAGGTTDADQVANLNATGIWFKPVTTFISGLNLSGCLGFSSQTSASSFTLGNNPFYIHTGAAATWTLPTIASTSGRTYLIKNKGSGLTLSGNGSDTLYSYKATGIFVLNSGDASIIVNDGINWSIF
jgi:hypothetical protein